MKRRMRRGMACCLALMLCSWMGLAQAAAIPNPMREVSNAAVIQEELGLTLLAPDAAENALYFIVADTLAEAQFSLNGVDCRVRAKKADAAEDISGVYDTFPTEATLQGIDFAYTLRYQEGGAGLVTWYNDFWQTAHSLYVASGATEEGLKELFVQCIPQG